MAKRDDERLQRIWLRYKQRASRIIKNALIKYYRPLLRIHARKLRASLPGCVSVDDLISAGALGLISAVEAFDPSRGTKFETFSAQRIRGAMYDELRRQDWVPRLVRERAKRMTEAVERFRAESGREPSESELEEHLHMNGEMLRRMARDSRPAAVFSMSYSPNERHRHREEPEINDVADASTADPARETQRRMLRDYITRGLNNVERLIILLYYYEQLSMYEIGKTLGLSEARVCQIHQRTLEHLRSRIDEKFLREEIFA